MIPVRRLLGAAHLPAEREEEVVVVAQLEVPEFDVARCRWGTETAEFLLVQLVVGERLFVRRRHRLRRR